MSYYCLARDVWEPILEPVMDPKNDRAPPILWFMRMQVRGNSNGQKVHFVQVEDELVAYQLTWNIAGERERANLTTLIV